MGLDAELNVRIRKAGFDIQLPLGKASVAYNGLEGALWFRAESDDPFAGTPLSFLQVQGSDAEGVFYTDGRMSFTIATTLPLVGSSDLDLLVHFDHQGIEAEVDGELRFSAGATIDGLSASCSVRAGAEGTVRFSYANGLRTSGSLQLDGRVSCEAGGQTIATARFDVGASFDNDSITVDLPYVGDQTLHF
jgi:hypothetical protein